MRFVPVKSIEQQSRLCVHRLGVGPVTASAAVTTVGDFKQFRSGAQLGAWLGLVPKQHPAAARANPRHHHQTR